MRRQLNVGSAELGGEGTRLQVLQAGLEQTTIMDVERRVRYLERRTDALEKAVREIPELVARHITDQLRDLEQMGQRLDHLEKKVPEDIKETRNDLLSRIAYAEHHLPDKVIDEFWHRIWSKPGKVWRSFKSWLSTRLGRSR